MKTSALRYPSGEEILIGDRVLYGGIPAEIYGIEPEHVLIYAPSLDAVTAVDANGTRESDLEFIGRARPN
jgi:hypothetical protein